MRPAVFNINHFAPLGRGLVFAGLGCGPGAVQFNDSSINGNNGTLTNMVPADDWVDAKGLGRKALDFDGSSDYVSLPSIDTPHLTAASWAYFRRSSNWEYVFSRDSDASNRHWLMGRKNAGNAVIFLWDENATYLYDVAGSVIPQDTWTHLAMRYDGTRLEMFINGVFDTLCFDYDGTGNVKAGTTIITLGKQLNGGALLDGQLADPCMWNRALSDNEIAALADPSNTLLSGLIWTPRSRSYFYAKAPAAGGATPWLYRPINSQTIGVCA